MKNNFRLLNHPFYQAWSGGKLTLNQISNYGSSYLELIEQIPTYWQKILHSFGIEDTLDAQQIVKEEKEHINLWKKWIIKLQEPKDFPSMKDVTASLFKISESELLGAISSFEMQQPKVANTKKSGLLEHFGFEAEDLTYFDEHLKEEKHIQFAKRVREHYSNHSEFQQGYNFGKKLFYEALDRFLSN